MRDYTKTFFKTSVMYVLSFMAFFVVLISFGISSYSKIKNENLNFIETALTIATPIKKILKYEKKNEEYKSENIYLNVHYLNNKTEKINSANKDDNIDFISKILNSVPKYELNKKENDKTFGIKECLFGTSGLKCSNFFINNRTEINVNFLEKLNENLDFKIPKNNDPKVLVMHTHTSESYIEKDSGFYYQSTSFRSMNNKCNVILVGDAICKVLENNKIKAIHSTVYHDTPMFTGSYKRSAETIKKILEKNPSIKVVLDIHRDTIECKDKKRIKPTVKIDGKKAAQVMIISGCDTDGSLNYPNWPENLKFSLKLQREIESLYPGLTRSLLFTHARYNQHLTKGSTLIEVGSDSNTLEEAVYSGILIGKALSRLLDRL